MLFDNSMKLLWLDGAKRGNILLFVTTDATQGLLYLKSIHITCLARGLHRVAEEI